ncbi:hypothetical protein CO615_04565 [Lysobacteraceae bacterium NML75-0749]|nr:hypothetical protein CO615_04565 [Xanthomonadaceae bacterium NML75-0749]
MKRRDLVSWLKKHGTEFKEGGGHTKAYRGERQSTVPRHTEIDKELAKEICSQLGIKKPPFN